MVRCWLRLVQPIYQWISSRDSFFPRVWTSPATRFGRGKPRAIPCPPFKHVQNKKVEGRGQSKKSTDSHEEITNYRGNKHKFPSKNVTNSHDGEVCFFFPTPNFFSSTPALFTARKKPLKIARVSLLKTIEWQWKYEQMNELMCLLLRIRWIFHLAMSVFWGSVNFWALWITYLNKKNMLPPKKSLFRSSNPGRWEAVGHATDCWWPCNSWPSTTGEFGYSSLRFLHSTM